MIAHEMPATAAEAKALLRVLLVHQRACHAIFCAPGKSKSVIVDTCLITYSALSEAAGLPHLTRAVGIFLDQIAEWCVVNNYPPINALVVNLVSRMPGSGYGKVTGRSLLTWGDDVEAAVKFNYPEVI